MQVFDGKVIFVAGATCALGRQLLPMLQQANARVVLMDKDPDTLCDMASVAPHRIEPLPVPDPSVKTYGQIGQIWENQPLDFLIDLLPWQKSCEAQAESNLQWAETNLALICGLKPGLQKAGGTVVSVIPHAAPGDPLPYQMSEAGLCRMAKVLAQRWRQDGIFYNVMRPQKDSEIPALLETLHYVCSASDLHLSGLNVGLTAALD